MTTPDVKLYTLSTCSHCKSTKNLLNECRVAFHSVDIDLLTGEKRQALIDEVRQLNPNCTFPTIVIDGKVIVGFKENEIRKALGLS
ncbi:MAG: glutaredoxin family protein [Thermodesulfobacteriota bacterium]